MNDKKNLIPIYRLFPNIVTIISILLGLTAIKSMFFGRWEFSAILILLAVVLDFIDGRVARMLNAETFFGAQLDSLADFCNFGIVPALLMYLWKLHEIRIFGWMLTMLYVISIVIRLARFNVSNASGNDKEVILNKFFFFGIPAPIAALLFIIPLLLSQDDFWYQVFIWMDSIYWLIFYGIFISFLVVSKIATFSTKNLQIPANFIPLLLCFIGFYCIFIFIRPWIIIPISGFLFLISLPISHLVFYYYKKRL